MDGDLKDFLADMFGDQEKPKQPEKKPHPNPELVSQGWKPSYPNEEIPW